mgnify:CR=1 FL=1
MVRRIKAKLVLQLRAQGLSGTVNMMTISPLSVSGRQLSLGLRGERNDAGSGVPGTKSTGNRLSVSYVDQFADNTVGLALGYAHLNNPQQGQQFEAWGYDDAGRLGGGRDGLAARDSSRERLGGEGAGDLAGVGAAHAVTDGVQRGPHDEGVLVRRPVEPDVGEGAVSGGERHPQLTPRTGRWSRRCAADCPA